MIEELFEILNPSKIEYKELGFKLYGIFDGVQYPMLWSDLEDGSLRYDILFREENLRTEMEHVAPFLIELNFDSDISKDQSKILLDCYGKRGCIFLTTSLAFLDTLDKLREIFYVYTAEGIKGFFRFYDPNIFMELIREKDYSLLYTLFGNVHSYWCECLILENMIVQYHYDGRELSSKNYLLTKEEK